MKGKMQEAVQTMYALIRKHPELDDDQLWSLFWSSADCEMRKVIRSSAFQDFLGDFTRQHGLGGKLH
jgi:hypothetical protein